MIKTSAMIGQKMMNRTISNEKIKDSFAHEIHEKTQKFLKTEIGQLMSPRQEAFVFQPWIMAEVDEQAQLAVCGTKIIQKLRPMFINQRRNSFDLENDFLVADEIRIEPLNERATAVLQC